MVRKKIERKVYSSLACINSQPVKKTKIGEECAGLIVTKNQILL
jgi:hypothetical protein